MRTMPELEWVHSDYMLPSPIINVELDPVASAQLGLSRATAALALTASTSDLRVGEVWEGDYELPIIVKDDSDMKFSSIENLGVTSPFTLLSGALPDGDNNTVPLRQVAKVSPLWSQTRIMHRGGERCITVTAELARGTQTAAGHDCQRDD